MAGDWIKWVKGLSRRREVIVLARKLNMSRREAATACMEIWEWADNETHDGHVRGATRDDIDLMLGLTGFAAALEAPEVGWLKVNSVGVTFTNWDRNNSESAKRRALESRKKRRQRDLDDKKLSRKHRDKVPDENTDSLLLSSTLPDLLKQKLFEWLEYKRAKGHKYVPQSMAAMVTRAATLVDAHGEQCVVDAIDRAMANGWQGWDQPNAFTSSNQSQPKQRRRSIDGI